MSRDRTVDETFHIAFTTRAFATGIPTVLAGSPVVSAYEDASLTQITAGITLGVDHDSVVGLNMLTIVATGANGYEAGKDYQLVITTGTVGGVSVVGEVVGQFSLGLSASFTRLGAPAGASVSADIAVIEGQTDDIGVAGAGLTDINLPNQTMDIVGNITGNLSGSVGSVTGAVGSVTGNVGGNVVGSVGSNADINTTGGAIDVVTLVTTTTTNTDMRGTDSGATAANLATVDTNVDSILVDTAEIGAAGAGLTDLGGMSTSMKAEVNAEVDGALDTALPASPTPGSTNDILDRQEEIIVAGAAATGTLSTTTMTTDLTVSVNDQYNGRILTFRKDTTTAALRGQQTDITDTVTTNGQLTFTALTTAPANGDTFEIT